MKKPHIHHAVPKNLLREPGTGFIYNSALQSGLFFSAAAHIFLVLAVGFVVPKVSGAKWIDNTLDVVIVNQSNNLENPEAKLSAQSDNLGGGDSEKEAATPVPWKAVNPSPIEQLALNTSSPIEINEVQEELLTLQGDSELNNVEEEKPTDKQEQQRQDKIKAIQQIQLERKRIAARKDKQWDEFQKRPRHEYLAPNTKSNESAAYQAELIEKINRVGNSNFPGEIRSKKISGKLTVKMALNRNGTINEIDILRPSGNILLDETAAQFIRMASPFKPFPDNMLRSDTDIINITRTFIFTPNTVSSEAFDMTEPQQ